MKETKLDIKLRIAGKAYTMNVDASREEEFRVAEKHINNLLAKYEAARLDGYATYDYLAVIAIQLAVVNSRLKNERNLDSEDVNALKELSDSLEKYLSR